tara:strand:+ start:7569 stop:7982 length:414 start_codon:yes stop_codon:yes gene_type:complete
MNEKNSWDPSLVKKFSSSNHFKLLNQLRNEVKKYPLNNKKNSTSYLNKDINQDNIKKQSDEHSQNGKLLKESNNNSDQNTIKSNISFNNSKNFSIYNQVNSNNLVRQNQNQKNAQSIANAELSTPSFKDRLDQIDMK